MSVFLRRERLRHAAAALGLLVWTGHGLHQIFAWWLAGLVALACLNVERTQILARAQHSTTDAFCIKATQLLDYLFQ
jgi:pyridoxine 5'-phosphate synthase PdxJ